MQEVEIKKFPIGQDEFTRRTKVKKKAELIASLLLMGAVFGPLTAAAVLMKPGSVISSFWAVIYLFFLLICAYFFIRTTYKIANRCGLICPKCGRILNHVSTPATRRCQKCGAQIVEEPR